MGHKRSKHKGISKIKSGKFVARFTMEDGDQYFIGSFATLRQAKLARYKALKGYYEDLFTETYKTSGADDPWEEEC